MTLLTYQIFQTVAEQGSFQHAAKVLNLTPSAISHAISTAEKELGFPLFNRSKNGVTLTEYGTKLQPYISAVLNSETKLQEAIGTFNGLNQGKIRIGTFSSFCQSFIPGLVTDFSKANPNTEITIYQGTSNDVRNWISTGQIDLGLLPQANGKDIPLIPLYTDELLCIAPKHFRPKHRSYIEFTELTGIPFICHGKNTDTDILQLLDENRIPIHPSCQVSDVPSAIAMVSAGFGLYLISKLTLQSLQLPDNTAPYPFKPSIQRTIGIYSPDMELMSPAVKAMYKHIIKSFPYQ
ncbi:MAG: LysR family transcriptional regulator [Lachnospiraceae bacterium]|nr:LysR family transcriptional regulator [Lachnospiraceae bacterium]